MLSNILCSAKGFLLAFLLIFDCYYLPSLYTSGAASINNDDEDVIAIIACSQRMASSATTSFFISTLSSFLASQGTSNNNNRRRRDCAVSCDGSHRGSGVTGSDKGRGWVVVAGFHCLSAKF